MFSSLRQPFKSSWILVIVILHFVNGVTQDKDEQVSSPSSSRLPLDTERRIAALPVDTLSPESKLNSSNWKWRSVLYNASDPPPRIRRAASDADASATALELHHGQTDLQGDEDLETNDNGGEDLGEDTNNESSKNHYDAHDKENLQNELQGPTQALEEANQASSLDWGGKLINNTDEIRELSGRNRRELIVLEEEPQQRNYNQEKDRNMHGSIHNAALSEDAEIPFSRILRRDREDGGEDENEEEQEVEDATNKIADIELFKLRKRKEEDHKKEIVEAVAENADDIDGGRRGGGSGSSSSRKFHFQEERIKDVEDETASDPLEVIPLSDSDDNSNPSSETLRIIPQLVNVTTENVYVSLESEDDDEGDEDKIFKNHLSTFDSSENRDRFNQYPGIRLPDSDSPPVITVNSSGIFPHDVLPQVRGHDGLVPGETGDDIFPSFTENLGSSNSSRTIAASWGNKIRKLSNKPSSLNESLEGIQIIDQLDQAFQDEEAGEEGAAGEEDGDSEGGGEAGKTLMMRRRPRRSVVHLYDMVVCATGCNPLIYKGYGCFCGFMGSGLTVDGIDKCCFKHDWCYHHAKCPPLLTYFVPYYWTCNAGRPKCVSDFRGWQGICGAHLCECDRQFAECLKKYPCPSSRAMCMTSPWRMKTPPPQANYELVPVRPVRIDRAN